MATDPSGLPGGRALAGAPPLVLVDTSAWAQTSASSAASARITELARAGRLATCFAVAFQRMYSARTPALVRAKLAAQTGGTIAYLPCTSQAELRALDVQARLSDRGYLRGYRMPDLLVAAVAEQAGATVLHYDRDFDRIADVTRQSTEWIIPCGTGHGNDKSR